MGKTIKVMGKATEAMLTISNSTPPTSNPSAATRATPCLGHRTKNPRGGVRRGSGKVGIPDLFTRPGR